MCLSLSAVMFSSCSYVVMDGTYKPHVQFLCLKPSVELELSGASSVKEKKINAVSFRSFSSVLLYFFFFNEGVYILHMQ